MSNPVIQTSFNAGEWAPALYSRVDLQKYHSGAALLQNFFVDYRGGATTRPGQRYVGKALNNNVRLIPFRASFTVTYVLEFGPGYIRFITNGAYVLENATSITAAGGGAPTVFTDTAHGYSNGDWLFIAGSYYIVAGATANTFTLTDLFANAINSNPFSLPVNAQRVYTLTGSPYQAQDLFLIKYAQDVNLLFLCHPNYPPYVLTLLAATNWTIAACNFTPTILPPTGLSIVVAGTASSFTYSYIVTSVDANGQESNPSTPVQANTVNGNLTTQTISWTGATNAIAYNVYRTGLSATSTIPTGIPYGFIGTTTNTKFLDTNLTPNFAETAPSPSDPFAGSGIQNVVVNTAGTGYTSVPTVTFTTAPAGGTTALGTASMTVVSSSLRTGGSGYVVGNIYPAIGYPGVTITPLTLGGGNAIVTYTLDIGQVFNSGALPQIFTFTSSGAQCSINANWGVLAVIIGQQGAGYLVAPTITFTLGGGSGTTTTVTLGASSFGNPTVPQLVQQRLFLGGLVSSPAQFNMSQPGAPFNFNVNFPITPDSAIQATLTSTTLHSIKSAIPVSAGLVIFTDQAAWLINGGTAGSPISATQISANPQGYSGAGDIPPITTPNDILYVQAKGSIVRDLSYNFYLNNYVGADVSILASHLFYGYSVIQWAFAEEPFKLVWAVRNDGTLLCFTFAKEQELLAWTHHITQGSYASVAAVNENTAIGNVDAVYVAVNRTINGQTVTYIERMVELTYPNDYISSQQVDANIGYNGAPAVTFSGAQHLAGAICTGVADGVVINFTMPANGTFVFGGGGTAGLTGIANASIVTVGLAFSPEIITLPLDLGEPTVQSKRKKIAGVTLKVNNALGLSMGRTLATVQPLQDLILGNVGSMTNQLVTGLVSGDARGYQDPLWDVPGQYVILQPNPYPASVLGVIPELEIGDTK